MLEAPRMKLRTKRAFFPGKTSSMSCRTSTWPDQALLGVRALALDAIAPEGVHRLGRQAKVRAYRNSARCEKAHRLGELRPAFELHHLRARCHQLRGAAERLRRRLLIAAERHVADEKGALAAARDAARVIGHLRQGDGKVVSCPCSAMPRESPTRSESTPAASSAAAKLAS